MQPTDAFNALSTSEKLTLALYKFITGQRGIKRTVVLELKQNIELIRLYAETEGDPKDLIHHLSDQAFRSALQQGFNFNSLQRGQITEKSTQNTPQLIKYHGWDTQKMFENIYEKVVTLKHATKIKQHKKPIRLGIRLQNLFKLMRLLAIHIGD